MIIQCWIIAMLLHVFFVYVSCIFKFEFFLWKSHVCVCVHVSAIDYLHDDIDCSVSFIVEFYSFFLLWYHHHWLYSLIYFIPLFENWLPWKKLLLISESPNKQHSSLSLSLSFSDDFDPFFHVLFVCWILDSHSSFNSTLSKKKKKKCSSPSLCEYIKVMTIITYENDHHHYHHHHYITMNYRMDRKLLKFIFNEKFVTFLSIWTSTLRDCECVIVCVCVFKVNEKYECVKN